MDDPLEREAETAAQRANENTESGIASASLSAGVGRVARAPMLQRDDGLGEKKEETPFPRVPYREKAPTGETEPEEGEEKGPTLTLANAARPTCDPKGFLRKDYLVQPNTSTDDFGLTRFSGTVSMALTTRKVKGGVMLEPLKVAMPAITSVFTKDDTFIEGTVHFVNQGGADCPSGKVPLQWRIFSPGAAKIREGEMEHCEDLQYAYDVTFGWYAQVVDGLIAKGRTFLSEAAAFKHLQKLTGTAPANWPSIFECLAKKTKNRDGSKFTNAWHTPQVKPQPPRLDDIGACSLVQHARSARALGAQDFADFGLRELSQAAVLDVGVHVQVSPPSEIDTRCVHFAGARRHRRGHSLEVSDGATDLQTYYPSWSPDGTKLAFYSGRDGDGNIYSINVDGSGLEQLTDADGVDLPYGWSVGDRILFGSTRSGDFDIWSMDGDGGSEKKLTGMEGNELAAEWSPDGSRIAFQGEQLGNVDLFVMNEDGSDQINLTVRALSDGTPRWAPDGVRLAFVSGRDANDEIYTIDTQFSDLTRVTNALRDDRTPAWSPDGTRIAFISNRDLNRELYVANADGSGQRRLTNDESWESVPEWSPDGSVIAFASVREGRRDIYSIRSDGTGLTRLTNDE